MLLLEVEAPQKVSTYKSMLILWSDVIKNYNWITEDRKSVCSFPIEKKKLKLKMNVWDHSYNI